MATTFGADAEREPVETTMSTAAPAVQRSANWVLTDYGTDGTVALNVWLTVPTTAPSPTMAVVAAICHVDHVRNDNLCGTGGDDEIDRAIRCDLRTGARILADDGPRGHSAA